MKKSAAPFDREKDAPKRLAEKELLRKWGKTQYTRRSEVWKPTEAVSGRQTLGSFECRCFLLIYLGTLFTG